MTLQNEDKKYLEDFKTYLSFEKNYSNNTIKSYSSDIISFLIWLDNSCINIEFNKLREYIYFIQKFNYKKNTLMRKIASIRSFYKYLYRERYINTNPADSLIAPKKSKSLPKFLTDDEMEKILDNVSITTPAGFRNKAILELLWATGMRVSELSGLNFADLSVTIGEAKIAYGNFIQTIVDFLIIAICIFSVIRLFEKFKKKEEAKPEQNTPAATAGTGINFDLSAEEKAKWLEDLPKMLNEDKVSLETLTKVSYLIITK